MRVHPCCPHNPSGIVAVAYLAAAAILVVAVLAGLVSSVPGLFEGALGCLAVGVSGS